MGVTKRDTKIVSKEDFKKCLLDGDLVITPFDENNVGPCDINLRISRKYARIGKRKDILDLYGENMNKECFFDDTYFTVGEGKEYIIQPNEHLLIESLEYLEVPTYLTALIGLRSTFSRVGLNTPPTLIDPGFKGTLVFHLMGSSFPIQLYGGMAIFKVIFMHISSDTEGYKGKYQGQRGIRLPKMDLNRIKS
jgi:dCTP deaminase